MQQMINKKKLLMNRLVLSGEASRFWKQVAAIP
jgi:hypothetical protein